MLKRKRVKDNGWKPLKLEGAILEGIDGLIGIEELTDYKLEKRGRTTVVSCKEKSVKAAAKRKHDNAWEEEKICDENESSPKKLKIVSTQKPNNCNKNKKFKNVESVDHRMECDTDDTSNFNENTTDINVKAWSTLGVPTAVIKALADQGFREPTPIQALTLAPAILGRRDILGAAETGSGKTLAFGIPIINGILESKEKYNKSINSKTTISNIGGTCLFSEQNIKDNDSLSSDEEEIGENSDEEQVDTKNIGCVRVIDNIQLDSVEHSAKKPLYALIITPTRELAIQVKDHLTKAAKYTDIQIAVVVGGMAAVKQERLLSKGPEIVIGTPGRLWELIQQGNPHLSQINSVRYLAIDETDRMLERGHFQELHSLLEKINMHESKRQMFVFSATLTMVHDIPEYLQRKKMKNARSKIFKLTPGQKLQKFIEMLRIKNPKIVDVTRGTGTADNLTECRIACTLDHKDYYLYYFLKKHPGRTLIFCNSIGCVKRLATLFSILDCKPLPLHASMQQRQRLKNLERFQADKYGILIATDVAARGLDIPNVEHVIHYQVPRTSEGYVHRSGRTARAQKEGITVLMMEPSEKGHYTKLCKTLGRTEDLPSFPVIDRLLIAVKERVDVAREIDKLELKCRRDNVQKGWLQKAAEDLDVILDEDQMETTMETKEVADLKRELKVKKHQLNSLLGKPLFPKGFSGKYPDINSDFYISKDTERAVEVMKKAIEENPVKSTEKSTERVSKRQNAVEKKKMKKIMKRKKRQLKKKKKSEV